MASTAARGYRFTMSTTPQIASIGAPVESFVRLIRGRHKPDILINLGRRVHRFAELRRAIPTISERVLARQLDALEQDGLVTRTEYPGIPQRVEYALTPFGRTLCPLLKQNWKWGDSSNPASR